MEKYLCNGKTFTSYDAVIEYCKGNNFRVINTETVRKNTYLITIKSI